MQERGRPRERAGAPWTLQSVLATIPHPPPSPNTLTTNSPPTTPLPFFHLLARLKTTPRSGWVQVGISHGESIADHMYRMAVMAMIPPPTLAAELDVPRCVAMALVHDMAECLVGDFTPRDGIAKGEKARREGIVMRFIQGGLLGGYFGGEREGSGSGSEDEDEDTEGDDGETGDAEEEGGKEEGQKDGLIGLFEEYEANRTLEARFLHDVDKLEMLLQVLEYERATGRRLDEFYHVVEEIRLTEMREWAAVVVQEREEFFASLAKRGNAESKKEKGSWICRWFRRKKKGSR